VIFYNKAFADEITTQRKVFNYFIMSVGTLFGGISAIASFYELISAFFIHE
jgi:hypothetical protein